MHASFAHLLKPARRSWYCEDCRRPILPWLGGLPQTQVGPVRALLATACCGTVAKAMVSSRPTSISPQPAVPETDQPTSVDLSDAPRIGLPKNLARTLQFLSDDDLETLRASVELELARRPPTSSGPITRKVAAVQPAIPARSSRSPKGARHSVPVPAGKISLIRASYHAGMKPAAIARTLRVSMSVVSEVLSTEPKMRP